MMYIDSRKNLHHNEFVLYGVFITIIQRRR